MASKLELCVTDADGYRLIFDWRDVFITVPDLKLQIRKSELFNPDGKIQNVDEMEASINALKAGVMILFTKSMTWLDLKKEIDNTFCGMIEIAKMKVKKVK